MQQRKTFFPVKEAWLLWKTRETTQNTIKIYNILGAK